MIRNITFLASEKFELEKILHILDNDIKWMENQRKKNSALSDIYGLKTQKRRRVQWEKKCKILQPLLM
jgi:hypothetical protein